MRKTQNPKSPPDLYYCEPQLGGELVVLRRFGSVGYWYAVIYLPKKEDEDEDIIRSLESVPLCTADLCTVQTSLRCPCTNRRVVVFWLDGIFDQCYDEHKPIERLYVRVRDFIRRYLSDFIVCINNNNNNYAASPSPSDSSSSLAAAPPMPSKELSTSTSPSPPPPPINASAQPSRRFLKRKPK